MPVIRMTCEHSHWTGAFSMGWNHETLQSFDVVIDEAVNCPQLAEWSSCNVDARNAMAGVKVKPRQVWKA